MYLPDARYATLVAFIEGVTQGSGSGPLAEFQDWLAGGNRTPRHWSAQVLDRVSPGGSLATLTPSQEEEVKALLLSLLGEYLRLRKDADG